MPLVFMFFLNFRVPFLVLDPFEILSYYSITGSFHWFSEDFQRIIKNVAENSLWFKLLRHFLLALFGFCLSLLLFSSSVTCCKVLLMKYE